MQVLGKLPGVPDLHVGCSRSMMREGRSCRSHSRLHKLAPSLIPHAFCCFIVEKAVACLGKEPVLGAEQQRAVQGGGRGAMQTCAPVEGTDTLHCLLAGVDW